MNARVRRTAGGLVLIVALGIVQGATWASQPRLGGHHAAPSGVAVGLLRTAPTDASDRGHLGEDRAAMARRDPRVSGEAGPSQGRSGKVAAAPAAPLAAAPAAPLAAAPAAPARLSETGLYVTGTLRVDPRNRPFSPQYPLWSDGARKSRWVYLPAGSSIDATRADDWDFPAGTRFWKEFTFEGRKVETRLLAKHVNGQWTMASYVWNDAQTDAELAPDSGVPGLVEIAPARRHSVPSVTDCRACHDSARTEVLGFNMLQLSTDRDPHAPHAEPLDADMVTLKTLVEERRLTGVDAGVLARPPRVRAATPTARAALGYLSANCGGCHNTSSSLASLGLILKHSHGQNTCLEPGVRTTVNHPTAWLLPNTSPGETVTVHPGSPERSALLARMRSRRAASQMPPLGTVIVDREAVDLVSRWIAEDLPHTTALADTCAPEASEQ